MAFKLKLILAIAAGAVLLSSALYLIQKTYPEPQFRSGVSVKDRDLLLKGIHDPYVVQVRTEIDAFNAGRKPEMPSRIDLRLSDLNLYKEYLKSKFVLLEVNNAATMGGKDMFIVFVDKPDKVFYAWVYQNADGKYEMRAFEPYDKISPAEAKGMYEHSKPMVEEFGLAI
jgi:hypothetical protein